MSEGAVVLLTALVLVWSLCSGPLERVGLTGPIVFLVAGIVVANGRFDAIRVGVDTETVHVVAEVTLALVLFADASGVAPGELFHGAAWPARLLGLGLPLSLLLGTGAGLLLLGGVPWQGAALAAAALVATDAALS